MSIFLRLVVAGPLLLAGAAFADVAGTYDVTQFTPVGEMQAVVVINEDGTGTVTGRRGENPIENAVIDGNDVSWTVTVKTFLGKMRVAWSGTVDGDTFSGTITNRMGEARFSGTRRQAESGVGAESDQTSTVDEG